MKIAIILSTIFAFCPWPLVFANAQPMTKVFEVQIDGQVFDVPGGEGTTIILKDGHKFRIRVREKNEQSYKTENLQFNYDIQYSIKDDFSKKNRTIVMLHASGFGLVITEFGRAKEYDERKLLEQLASNLEARVRRGVAKDFKKGKPTPVDFSHSKGRAMTFNYLDEDDDRMVFKIHVLESKGRIFSVTVFHDRQVQDNSGKLSLVVLQSVRGVD